ncbi:tetratricopeptide repeat protein 14 [Protopterus annectens]|uniref:tetratricopeptide repeat protein 14 n=1 Tax=Protopterus annectens TaxID=7888 RepID=UPI001CFB6A89|nr:tetratricopeptide repeat protein 14 [Protopterus annectens]
MMDRDLLHQSLGYHGPNLLSLLRCEQYENPDFQNLAEETARVLQNRKERRCESFELQHFIARKADLLFSSSWKTNLPPVHETTEETEDYYAIMPPVELFMDVPDKIRRELFFRDTERGDIVVGRITSIREFGFFMTLICLGGSLGRDIEHLEISVLCPLRDVPSHSSHDDPLSYYQVGDLIQGLYAVVFHHHIGYWRSCLKVALLFAEQLQGSPYKHFLGEDYATVIRKKQSASWALKCVKSGVDHFKAGRHVEAMNEYNKALEMDTNNVEALVARGALFATKGSLNKAIDDFEMALENCATHRNARKYLCQTLVERGRQLEEEEKLLNAESCYKKAFSLDETFQEADDALQKLRKHIQKSLEKKEKEEAKDEKSKEKKMETSVEKLRKLLKEEKRVKKRKKRLTSSSSDASSDSSVTSVSSSSSSSHKKRKKQKRRHSESSYSAHKHATRVSSFEEECSKNELYPLPANTSASFLIQKQEVAKLLEKHAKSEFKEVEKCHLDFSCSVKSEDYFEGRSEHTVEHPKISRKHDSFSKHKKSSKDRCSEKWKDSSESCSIKVYEKGRLYDSKRNRDAEADNSGLRCKKFEQSQRRYSTSSAGSEYSYKSSECHRGEKDSYQNDSSNKYERHRNNSTGSGEGRKYQSNDSSKYRKTAGHDRNWKGSNERDLGKKQTEYSTSEGVKKQLPQNLLDIFNQIAEFEKEKYSKQVNKQN